MIKSAIYYSDCCGVDIKFPEQNFCPKCEEHCGYNIPCEKCKGDGQLDRYLYERRGMRGGNMRVFEVITCPDCGGEGFIPMVDNGIK